VGRAEVKLQPLRRFLLERGWPQRIATYDQYGGPQMLVMLTPAPSQEQLDVLHAEFGDTYDFDQVYAQLQEADDEQVTVGDRRASTTYGETPGLGAGPPEDAVWLIEEWDGSRWRRVREVRGVAERDRLLQRK
jgi:hypothetical protein